MPFSTFMVSLSAINQTELVHSALLGYAYRGICRSPTSMASDQSIMHRVLGLSLSSARPAG